MLLPAPECVYPTSPSSTQELRDDCTAFRILTLSSFFPLLLPSPTAPFPACLFLPQGLSHLMMSEQGRCGLLAVLQLPDRLPSALAGGSDPPHRRGRAACSSVPGQAGGRALCVGGHLSRCIVVPLPRHLLGFAIPHICHRALPLQGCLGEGSMKQGMTVSIMGVNGANFRATERLTSSCSSPRPMLGLRERSRASP